MAWEARVNLFAQTGGAACTTAAHLDVKEVAGVLAVAVKGDRPVARELVDKLRDETPIARDLSREPAPAAERRGGHGSLRGTTRVQQRRAQTERATMRSTTA